MRKDAYLIHQKYKELGGQGIDIGDGNYNHELEKQVHEELKKFIDSDESELKENKMVHFLNKHKSFIPKNKIISYVEFYIGGNDLVGDNYEFTSIMIDGKEYTCRPCEKKWLDLFENIYKTKYIVGMRSPFHNDWETEPQSSADGYMIKLWGILKNN